MEIQPSGSSNYTGRLFMLQEERSEKLANYWRLCLSFIGLIIGFSIADEVPAKAVNVIVTGSTGYFFYSLFMFFWLRAGRYHPAIKYLNLTVDIAITTAIIWMIGTYRTFKSTTFFIYFIWLSQATVRLSPRLIIYAGALTILMYSGVIWGALYLGTIEPGTMSESHISHKVSVTNQILKLTFVILTVLPTTYVSMTYRKLATRAYEDELDLERQRMKAQKMESIGFLAGGIAHDFNNILAIIVNNLYVAKHLAEPGSKVVQKLEAAETASLKAKALAQQLLTFARGGSPVRKSAQLDTIISDVVNFAFTGSTIKCQLRLPAGLWTSKVDEGQITQVINNILINALQASPEGGTIEVEADNLEVAGDSMPLKEGPYVRISISDQGSGIAAEHMTKIFDPYFTTKETGSGLGLAISYSIIASHDGHINAASSPDGGTVFDIYLPASDAQCDVAEERASSDRRALYRILVMDDEEGIRSNIGEALSLKGHSVATASNGSEAIELYSAALQSGSPFDVVVMDLTIPGGMGGREAMARLLEIDPGVRAIVASGYSNDPVLANHVAYGFKGMLSKPFRMERLLDEVDRLMA